MRPLGSGEPARARVALVEGNRSEVEVLRPLLGGEPFTRLLPWDEPWLLSPRVLFWTAVETVRGGGLEAGYLLALLRLLKPALVVTYVDNSLAFQRAAQLFKGARFLAIQNGGRLVARDHNGRKVHHDVFACFGRLDEDQYRAAGAEVARYVPVGSLKDAYYRAQAGPAPAKRWDLCFVSQIKPTHDKVYPKTMASLRLLGDHLRRFAAAHGKTVCVAARRGPSGNAALHEWESAWFRERLGPSAEIVPNVRDEYTSYRTIDASRVSLGMHTTLLREAFGRGQRILSCNFSGDAQYDFPLKGPWALSDPSYEAFESRLLELLALSDAEYAAKAGDKPRYAMQYDAKKPTDTALRELIKDLLASAGR